MDIKTNYEDYTISGEELFCQKQVITQSNIDVSQKGEISKILFNEANSVVVKTQIIGKQIKIQGKTFVKVCYCDIENNIKGLDYVIDFTESVLTNDLLKDETIDFKSNVIDSIATIIGEEIRVQNVIQLWGYKIVSKEQKLLTQIDGAIYKTQEATIQTFERYLNEFETITQDISIEKPIDEVILYTPKSAIISVEPMENKINIVGQISVDILYKSNNEIEQKIEDFTFSKEIDSIGLNPVVCPYILINDSRLIIPSDMQGQIRLELDTFIKGALFNIEQKEIIEDLYSPSAIIETTKNNYEYFSKVGLTINESRLNATAKMEDNIKKIISISITKEDIVPIVEQDGIFVSEGIIYATIIYINDNNETNSHIVEMPYAFEVNNSKELINCDVYPEVLVLGIYSKLKSANELELVVNVVSGLCNCKNIGLNGISEVVIKEEKKECHCAIRIYKPQKGESLWDVAKRIGVGMDEISKQNNDIKDVMDGNENILVFKEIGTSY